MTKEKQMNMKLKLRIIERFNTQADFAQALGVDESVVSRVVRRRRTLDTETQNAWACLLACEPETIFPECCN